MMFNTQTQRGLMIKKILPFLLFASAIHAQECPQDTKIQEVVSPCQKAYYRFAPECRVGDSICLSLTLHGLVSKNLFDYRSDIRRNHNTPLKQKVYRRTKEYKTQYTSLLKDLKEAKSTTFCAEMSSYWLYDLKHKGFLFNPYTLIPKSKLFRATNTSKVFGYEKVSVSEREATDIESWENIASSKYVFFKLSERQTDFVQVRLTHFAWFAPNISFDHEGETHISHYEGCGESSHYIYRYER